MLATREIGACHRRRVTGGPVPASHCRTLSTTHDSTFHPGGSPSEPQSPRTTETLRILERHRPGSSRQVAAPQTSERPTALGDLAADEPQRLPGHPALAARAARPRVRLLCAAPGP